ncbi:MAG TPA: hypothetical protein VH144_03055 [Candidatus Saccharimonadales bacterium]|jgi:hypothetical protein|nr:hypothetical protein [Candidatus Saccharimonadales bacterium]
MKDQKKTTKNQALYIHNAGQTAEIMGWIAIILVPPAFLFNRGNLLAIAIWFVYLLLGIYLVWSGRRVRYQPTGQSTGPLLVLNGIACIPMIPAVFPIIGVVQSFATYARYRRLTEQISPKPKLPLKTAGKIALGVWTIVVLAALVYGLS